MNFWKYVKRIIKDNEQEINDKNQDSIDEFKNSNEPIKQINQQENSSESGEEDIEVDSQENNSIDEQIDEEQSTDIDNNESSSMDDEKSIEEENNSQESKNGEDITENSGVSKDDVDTYRQENDSIDGQTDEEQSTDIDNNESSNMNDEKSIEEETGKQKSQNGEDSEDSKDDVNTDRQDNDSIDGQTDEEQSTDIDNNESSNMNDEKSTQEGTDNQGNDSNSEQESFDSLSDGESNSNNNNNNNVVKCDSLPSISNLEEDDEEELEESDMHDSSKEVDEENDSMSKPMPEQSSEFLNKLNDLQPFENRQRNNGYEIDANGSSILPESIIRTLITKFLNQRYCKRDSDLNHRTNSLEKCRGFYKWEVKDVIVHYKTHQVTKVLKDKYAYDYADGQSENVPLSFYFDLSGSMSAYTNMLATMAIELLKKNVKVLVGYNERVNVQIESIDRNTDVASLAIILKKAGEYGRCGIIKDSRVNFKYVSQNIDNYLINKKAEKCVVFTDFDPKTAVINLSKKCQVYWFCFEPRFTSSNVEDFDGFIYQVSNAEDILAGLIKVNENRFETLCFIEKNKVLKKEKK